MSPNELPENIFRTHYDLITLKYSENQRIRHCCTRGWECEWAAGPGTTGTTGRAWRTSVSLAIIPSPGAARRTRAPPVAKSARAVFLGRQIQVHHEVVNHHRIMSIVHSVYPRERRKPQFNL